MPLVGFSSPASLCNLCGLCVSVVIVTREFFYHRDTEDTEVAQRRQQCFIIAKLSHDSSTEDLNVHDIKQG